MSKRTERSATLEPEFRALAAAHGGSNVDGGGSGLADGMLGRGRNLSVGDGLDGGAVTQRPDLAFVVLQFEAGIDEQLAASVGAIELLNYRRKCRWHSGNERLARDLDAGLQNRSFRRGRLQPVIENNFDAALPQDSLGKFGKCLRHFRQNTIAGLNDHAAVRFRCTGEDSSS